MDKTRLQRTKHMEARLGFSSMHSIVQQQYILFHVRNNKHCVKRKYVQSLRAFRLAGLRGLLGGVSREDQDELEEGLGWS